MIDSQSITLDIRTTPVVLLHTKLRQLYRVEFRVEAQSKTYLKLKACKMLLFRFEDCCAKFFGTGVESCSVILLKGRPDRRLEKDKALVRVMFAVVALLKYIFRHNCIKEIENRKYFH